MKKTAISPKNPANEYFNEIYAFLTPYFQQQEYHPRFEKILDARFSQMMQMLPGIVVVVDLNTGGYLFVSENCSEIIGLSPKEFLEGGVQRTMGELTPPSHSEIIAELFPVMFRHFLQHCLKEDFNQISASYPSQLIHHNGFVRWYLHSIKILAVDQTNKPNLLLKLISDIHDIKKDGSIDFSIKVKRNGMTKSIFDKTYFPKTTSEVLTTREIEIITCISQGLTSKEIAEKLFISIQTVNTHRKNILKKTNCKGSIELARYVGGLSR